MSRTLILTGTPFVALLVTAAVAISEPATGRHSAGDHAAATDARAPDAGRPGAPARPATQPTADQMLGNMLRPRRGGAERELVATDPPALDRKSGGGSVAPHAPALTVLKEGTPLVNRVGRLTLGGEGGATEFVFESDGHALCDPPVIVLPNLKLMIMEDVARGATREPRFRVSGVVTEYRGRNYLLLDKVYVMSQSNPPVR